MSSTALALPIQGAVSTGLSLLITTIVFGLAAATALIRFTFAADIAVTAEIVWPSYGVPAGEAAVLLVPLPVFTKTSALLLPAAAAAASAMSPFTRENAKRKHAGPAVLLLNVIVTEWKVPPVS